VGHFILGNGVVVVVFFVVVVVVVRVVLVDDDRPLVVFDACGDDELVRNEGLVDVLFVGFHLVVVVVVVVVV
jgi:hypothetical protein